MWLSSLLKRQLKNIKDFKVFSFQDFVKNAVLFPIDYFLKGGKSAYPMNISWYSTMRCNLRCSFCYLRDVLNKPNKEMTFEEMKTLIEQVAKHKPSWYITGGEPLMRLDLVDIVREIKKHGMFVGISSNGTLLTKEKADALISAGLDYLSVSIDGGRETHDRVRGVRGAFDKAVNNLKYFCSRKTNTHVLINCTISKDNLGQLDSLIEVAKQTGVDELAFQHLSYLSDSEIQKPIGLNLVYHKDRMKPYRQEIVDAIVQLREKAKREGISVFFKPFLSDSEVFNWYSDDFSYNAKCFYPWRSLRLGSDGGVYPCPMILESFGNIRASSIEKVWNSREFISFRKELKKRGLFPECARCCKLFL